MSAAPAAPVNPRAAKQAWAATLRRLEAEEAGLRRDLDPIWGVERASVGRGPGVDWLVDIKKVVADITEGTADERTQITSRVEKARSTVAATLALLSRLVASAPGFTDASQLRAGGHKAFAERSARADAAIAAVKDHGRHRYGVLATEEATLEDQVRRMCHCLLCA